MPSTMDWAFRKGFLNQAFSNIQKRRITFRQMRQFGSSDCPFSSAFGKKLLSRQFVIGERKATLDS